MTASASDDRCFGCDRRLDDNRAPVCKYCEPKKDGRAPRSTKAAVVVGQLWLHDEDGLTRRVSRIVDGDVYFGREDDKIVVVEVEQLVNSPDWRYIAGGPSTLGDQVNSPTHYNTGKIEVIEAIEDWKLGFHEGNVVKYVARAKHKGKELQDLKKAEWYLKRRIKELEDADAK